MFKQLIFGSFLALTATAAEAGQLKGFTLATWNIQTLATDGRKVFDTSHGREGRDYADLRIAAEALAADVYALQEITSPAALARVFPLDAYVICLSGQWQADARGMGPIYDFAAVEAAGIGPMCFDDPAKPLPDTARTPGLGAGQPDPLLAQYTALAVRRSSGIRVEAASDLARLGVAQNDRDGATGRFVVRKLRWGLDVTLGRAGDQLRLLVVHMKSGCFDGFLKEKTWAAAHDAWQPADRKDPACEVYARQLPALRRWLAARKAEGPAFAVAGDFNRRFDLEPLDAKKPDLWPILTGTETPDPADDLALSHVPRDETVATGRACWANSPPEQRVAIDFFVFGPGVEPPDWKARTAKVLFTELKRLDGTPVAGGDPKAESARLSDHCPRRIAM